MCRVLILSLLLLLFCTRLQGQDIVVVRKDKEVIALQVNPKAFIIHHYRGKTPEGSLLSFNTSYYDPHSRKVIGLLLSQKTWEPFIYDRTDVRPCLTFTQVGTPSIQYNPHYQDYTEIIQAGPLLLKGGEIVYKDSLKRGHYASDTVKRTRQVSIGITKSGKLLVVYTRSWSIGQISEYLLSMGCTEGMKMDGGSSASLTVEGHTWGNPDVVSGFTFSKKQVKK